MCFAARDHANQLAFLGTTVLLTSLPVLMVGSVIVWVARRSRELDASGRPKRKREPEPQLPRDESASSARPGVATIGRGA